MRRKVWQIMIIYMSGTPNSNDHCPQKFTVTESPISIPLIRLLNQDVWIEQWPVIELKLSILKQRVAEQLKTGLIEPATNIHNIPICAVNTIKINSDSI